MPLNVSRLATPVFYALAAVKNYTFLFLTLNHGYLFEADTASLS